MSNGTCLVTGGAGFIGCAISSQLSKLYDRVIVVDNLHPQVHESRIRPDSLCKSVELVVADITEPPTWESLLSDCSPDTVIHLAAETGTGQSFSEASRHSHTNVTGTTTMLDAFYRHGIRPKRFVLTSSRAVYGEGAWQSLKNNTIFYPGQRSREQLAAAKWDFDGEPLAMEAGHIHPVPVSIYGATKLAQEHILASWCNASGSELVVLRLQNVFGPGQSLINPYTGIASLFCRLGKSGRSIPLYEDGMMLRDFVLIDDVAVALVRAAHKPSITERVLDIGGGVPITIKYLAEQIAEIYSAPKPHFTGEYRYGDVRHAFSKAQNARENLDWEPKISLQSGLRSLIHWIDKRA
ncbi:NAD-dependent epimerase/dehydratase family protein [Phyllobacterium sp. 22229]|uniref:NAD-dependent epimerase/dehydratase family protein n=1 Tax=Phyllobacterium sp. 22229 TaxID=3453895 RepID=UPI003F85A2F1